MGCHPSDVHYPGMKSHVARHTFNIMVYQVGQPVQLKRQENLAQASGLAAMSKAFGG